jgi:uncharacterized protein (TIGR02677 family)
MDKELARAHDTTAVQEATPSGDGTGVQRLLDQVPAFRYVTEAHAPTYRAIMQVFYEAKQHYIIELRPEEVRARVGDSGLYAAIEDDAALERRLEQLVEWGNLSHTHDTAGVSRVEDFERKRYLYHLTAIGEGAHRAVLEVEKTIGKSGSLQASMLVKIRDTLHALHEGMVVRDAGALADSLHDLYAAFATLTEEANRFIGELGRYMSSERADEERFGQHKQAVLSYVSRFVSELRRLAPQIAASVAAVDEMGIAELLDIAVEAADLPPALDDRDPRGLWLAEQRERWKGVQVWFVGAGGTATVERLAAVAVDAVVGLTRALERLNDRRTRPVDRAADFRSLARWFSECAGDSDAHALWQRASGLYPARHLCRAESDADTSTPITSWWDAAPVAVPVRLRARGRMGHVSRTAPAADHRQSKAWIAQRRRHEQARVDAALRRFAGRGPLRLSEVARLEGAEFDLLLALLDEALGAPRKKGDTRTARTGDGRLEVALHPPAHRDDWVTLTTPRGALCCLNYRIEVRDVAAARAGALHRASPVQRKEGA